MQNFLNIATIFISVVVIILVLLQGRGAGLGSAWGGAGEHFQTRRGVEKYLFRITILVVLLFCILSVVNILI